MRAPWAIVPVKALGEAKQRLAGVLPPEARRQLMLVMLKDVLATLHQVERLGPVLVVTPDAQAASLALSCGARVLREARGQGHTTAAMAGLAYACNHGAAARRDAACRRAMRHLGRGHASARSGGRWPLTRAWCWCPSRDGDGTNAVLAVPPDVFPLSFGPGSFARHLAAAEATGLDCRVVELAGLGMDIDEPRDLLDLMARKRHDPSYAFLWSESGPANTVDAGQS